MRMILSFDWEDISDKYLTHTGQILDKTGQRLNKYWTNTGQILNKYLTNQKCWVLAASLDITDDGCDRKRSGLMARDTEIHTGENSGPIIILTLWLKKENVWTFRWSYVHRREQWPSLEHNNHDDDGDSNIELRKHVRAFRWGEQPKDIELMARDTEIHSLAQ